MQYYDEIEYFCTIASTQNLSYAAKVLYITPAALSSFLSKLERNLGTTLFTRNKDSLQLTEAGKVYYEYAQRVSGMRESTLNRLASMGNPSATVFRIGVVGRLALAYVKSIWNDLNAAFPNRPFVLKDSTISGIYNWVLDGSLDLGIGALDYTQQRDFHFFLLTRQEIGLAIPAQHRLNRELREQGISPDDPVDIAVCGDEPILLPEKISPLTRTCKRYFDRERFKPVQTFSSLGSTGAQIASLMGLIHPTIQVLAEKADGMVFQRLKNPMYLDSGFFFSKERKLTQMDKELISLLQENKARY